MKTIIFLLLFSMCGMLFNAHAQSYKINKEVYDYKMYMPQPGDPHNPGVMGLASFVVPGLGQMLSGEVGRGLAFLGGSAACGIGGIVGAYASQKEVYTNVYGGGTIRTLEITPAGTAIFLTGMAAMLAIDIWAIVDAVKVAKVNNMYIQDLRGDVSSLKVEMFPFVDTNNYQGRTHTSAGLSLKVSF